MTPRPAAAGRLARPLGVTFAASVETLNKMITDPSALYDVGDAIKLALAPAFLLVGIAGLLNVMTGRLARIIDRGRGITEGDATDKAQEHVIRELMDLERRRYFTSIAITSSTFSALLVCIVVVALFVDVLLDVDLNILVGILFAASSLALVVGLAFFLREVHLATKTVRLPTASGG